MNLVNYGVRQNCKYLISTLVMVRLEPGNSGGRMRGNYEMGNEHKLRLKFAVVIVFFNPIKLSIGSINYPQIDIFLNSHHLSS